MRKNISTLLVLVALLLGQTMPVLAQDAARKGEKVIMTGFNFKDPAINALIEADAAKRGSYGLGHLVIPRALNKISETAFPDNALWVCKKLHDAGYHAYIVGGAVRDLLMNKDAADADITTDATLDQQRKIFGDMLITHAVSTDTFALVIIDKEAVDIAAFQPCPKLIIERGAVKDIKEGQIDIITDSYERDLAMNGILYDPYSGDIIDFHGGIRNLRDNMIDTNVDPDIQFMADHGAILVRTLRFQAKYDATLSPALEKALQEKAPVYIKNCARNALYANAAKLFSSGVAEKCYKNLLKYRVFDSIFPCLKLLKNRKAYNAWIEREVVKLDEQYAKGTEIKRSEALAAVTYPVYKQLVKKLGSEGATKKILEVQDPVMHVWEAKSVQENYETMLKEDTAK